MSNIVIDDSEVRNIFLALEPKKQSKVFKLSLKKAANIISKEAKKQLKNSIGKGASHNGKYGRMNKGIKVKVFKDKKNTFESANFNAKVHIMGDFRLKWFEMGTKERHIKKKNASRGSIKATNFFANSIEAKEQEATDSLKTNLRESIMRIYERRR